MTLPNDAPWMHQRVNDEEREAAVEHLRWAAGDGRLGLGELEARIEAALAATTYGDLAALTADLPPAPHRAGLEPLPEVVRLAVSHGHLERIGNWRVGRRLDVQLVNASAVIDLATPVLPAEGLDVFLRVHASKVVVFVPDDVRIDASELGVHRGKVKVRTRRPASGYGGVTIRMTGDLVNARLKVKSRPSRVTV